MRAPSGPAVAPARVVADRRTAVVAAAAMAAAARARTRAARHGGRSTAAVAVASGEDEGGSSWWPFDGDEEGSGGEGEDGGHSADDIQRKLDEGETDSLTDEYVPQGGSGYPFARAAARGERASAEGHGGFHDDGQSGTVPFGDGATDATDHGRPDEPHAPARVHGRRLDRDRHVGRRGRRRPRAEGQPGDRQHPDRGRSRVRLEVGRDQDERERMGPRRDRRPPTSTATT